MDKEVIIDEVSFRLEEDHDLRFTARTVVEEWGAYQIVERNGWFGVMHNKRVCVPTIYDSIKIALAGNNLVVTSMIMGMKGLWELSEEKSKELIIPIYDDIETSPYYAGAIVRSDNKEGLYCLHKKELILEPQYKLVTMNTQAKHIWAKEIDGSYYFLNRDTGASSRITKNIMPLEHNDFTVYMYPNGHLDFLEGDSFLLRKLVARRGGRLKLSNSRSEAIFITDANAFILNVQDHLSLM